MLRNVIFAAAMTGLFSGVAFAQSMPAQAPQHSTTPAWQSIVGGADATVTTSSPHEQNYQTRRVFHTQAAPDPDAYPYGVDQDWQIPVKSHS